MACLWASPSGAGLKGAVRVPDIAVTDPAQYVTSRHVTAWRGVRCRGGWNHWDWSQAFGLYPLFAGAAFARFDPLENGTRGEKLIAGGIWAGWLP
jgi:hypothetical protein